MSVMALSHYTVPARLGSVPGTTFSITKKYLLNVGGVVIATAPRNCRDFVLYATQTRKQWRTWKQWCWKEGRSKEEKRKEGKEVGWIGPWR